MSKVSETDIDSVLDQVLTVQYNLVTTNDLKKSLNFKIRGLLAQELRSIPQIDESLEIYLWKRIDELEERP